MHTGRAQAVEDRAAAIEEPPVVSNTTNNQATVLEAAKQHPKVILFCVLMTVGPMMYGFDNIIVSVVTAMPSFKEDFGEIYNGTYIIPSIWLALWNAMVQIGCMVGSLANGPLADRYGRRTTFSIGGLIGVGAIGIIYASDLASGLDQRRGVYLAGKTLLGGALGLLNSTCQTYISEVAPDRLRGPLLSLFTFFMVVGQLIAISIVYARIGMTGSAAYRVTFASQWACAGCAVLVAFVIPESPTHLLRRGNVEGACRSYRRLYDPATVDAGMRELAATLENEDNHQQVVQDETSYRDIFKGTNWRRTRIIFYANTLQQCLGVTLLSNSTYFLELAGMSANKSVMITEVGLGLGLPANVISWFAMTMLGRRTILLFSTGAVGLIWLGIGVAGCWPDSPQALWFIGVMLIVVVFFYGLGVGGAYPVVGAETSSVRLRAKSQGFGFLVNGFFSWAFNFFVPYMFDADEAALGGKIGFFFFGLCVIGVIIVYIEIPETKGRTYAELDEMFEKRLPTRLFASYVCENHIAQVTNEKALED
ncbi:hypothetical protein SEUCBS139899_005821 [Sporothrix eucalyptigena]|uniref:Major facilitator superfamily (MFS) profile domain-containing protein n=1 Tax=Sporothrix eucalyptigena TaxID=1812306 RepID=A0ABP0BNS6_9PEZI